MAKNDAERIAERIAQLIDVATTAIRNDGDEEAALLALQEAVKTAERLPQKVSAPDVICLPGPK